MRHNPRKGNIKQQTKMKIMELREQLGHEAIKEGRLNPKSTLCLLNFYRGNKT